MTPVLSQGLCSCGLVGVKVKDNIVKVFTDNCMVVDLILGIQDDNGRLLKHHQIPFGIRNGIAGVGVDEKFRQYFR